MSTTKRLSGDYTIETLANTANVTINTGNTNISNSVYVGAVHASNNSSFAGNVAITGNVTANNVTATTFVGDGTGLTGIAAGNALGNIISYGTSRVAIPALSGNVYVNVAGISNIAVFSTGGAAVTGNVISDGFYFSNGSPLIGSVKYDALPVAPVAPQTGDFWFNTTNGILYQYNDDGDTLQWVDQSGVATPPAFTSADANTVVQRDLNASITANAVLGNAVIMSGNITSTAGYFVGNGSQLTGVTTSATTVANGTSSVSVASSGNVTATVGGVAVLGVSAQGIFNAQANGVGNIGSASGYFNRVFAQSTSAIFSDLAEIYVADREYSPGTVLVFGGDQEVTVTARSHDHRVAGVVSTEPSYLMNAGNAGVAVALTGRVPCRVLGPVNQGDVLVTAEVPGVAQALDPASWTPGCVIGKSLEEFSESTIKIIEIAVGRY